MSRIADALALRGGFLDRIAHSTMAPQVRNELMLRSYNSSSSSLPSVPRACYADFGRVSFQPPKPYMSDEELKQWVWEHHQDAIFASMTIKDTAEQTELDKCRQRLELLEKVANVQKQYLQSEGPQVVYGCLLDGLLDLIGSEFGFIGEARYESDGTMYLHVHASSNIAWDERTRNFYEANRSNMRFYNMDTLFGRVLKYGKPVISNDPKNDPRSVGAPRGHPTIETFMGIPFFKEGGQCIGMFAVANKPGGYSEEDVSFLEPFTVTCSNLIQAYWQIQKNDHLIDTLESKVKERTRKLELANQELEAANRRVLSASAARLQHFACMSHEIRTPLNGILGLLSLLQETELSPMQEESMRMIVASGELLVTVVNDVLDYSKLESGHVDVEIQRSNLQETLNSIVHSIDMKATAKDIKLRTFYDPLLPEYVMTDSRRIQQILFNLLGNAVKFSSIETSVELNVLLAERERRQRGYSFIPDDDLSFNGRCPMDDDGCLPEAPLYGDFGKNLDPSNIREHEMSATSPRHGQPSACPYAAGAADNESNEKVSSCPFTRPAKYANRVTLSHVAPSSEDTNRSKAMKLERDQGTEQVLRFVVKDYGKGIDKSEFEKIFQPFLQASAETERVYGGTGLGLAITAKLVHALGGIISVDSEEGKWSEFTVDLPFREECADIDGFSQKLAGSTVFLINNLACEVTQHLKDVFKRYNVPCASFDNMEDLASAIAREGYISPERSYICLTHEDLYDAKVLGILARQASSVLLTFGPKYSVKETAGHYRCPTQVLPTVLIKSIIEVVESAKVALRSPPKKSPSCPSLSSMWGQSPSLVKVNSVPNSDLRILVAEDNIINQKVLARMLKRLNVEQVDIVDNGLKAVEQSAVKEYDVIFMDMQMPVMSGLDACRQIVARVDGRRKPTIVFVTAHVSHAYEVECAKAGGGGFLPKPFNISEIGDCLGKVRKMRESSRKDVPALRQIMFKMSV